MANVEIRVNGIKLDPQPARTQWTPEILGPTIAGPASLGLARSFVLTPPPIHDLTAFNWSLFENQRLNTLQAYLPDAGPDGAAKIFTNLVVSRPLDYTYDLERNLVGLTLTFYVDISA